MNLYPPRKKLPHDPPKYMDTSASIFILTICCLQRVTNQFCHASTARTLVDAAKFYQARHDWHIHLLVLMPDHLHMLVRFGAEPGMRKVVENWKRYTATHAGVVWQRDFFDHRLRREESFEEKAYYIRQNPIRGGWVLEGEPWPYEWQSNPNSGELQVVPSLREGNGGVVSQAGRGGF